MSILSEIQALIKQEQSLCDEELRRDLWSRCHWSGKSLSRSREIRENLSAGAPGHSRDPAIARENPDGGSREKLIQGASPGSISPLLSLSTSLVTSLHQLTTRRLKTAGRTEIFRRFCRAFIPAAGPAAKHTSSNPTRPYQLASSKFYFDKKKTISADNFNVRKKNSCRVIKVAIGIELRKIFLFLLFWENIN